jgi:uncharacterized RDD family membrane protein YckC
MENKNFIVTDDLLASKGQRFLNFIIDMVIVYIIEITIGTTIIIIGDLTNGHFLSDWVKTITKIEGFFFGLIILFFYYGFTEMYFSRTFAKYITKTVTVKKDGSKPNSRAFIIRTLCRLIPFEPFSFLGSNPRGWHDTISDTYVVKKHEFIEKRKLFDAESEENEKQL